MKSGIRGRPGKLASDLGEYIAGLVVSEGQGVGDPFSVLPWERGFIRGAFARVPRCRR